MWMCSEKWTHILINRFLLIARTVLYGCEESWMCRNNRVYATSGGTFIPAVVVSWFEVGRFQSVDHSAYFHGRLTRTPLPRSPFQTCIRPQPTSRDGREHYRFWLSRKPTCMCCSVSIRSFITTYKVPRSLEATKSATYQCLECVDSTGHSQVSLHYHWPYG